MTRACALVAAACLVVASQRTAKAVRHESPSVARPPVAHGFSRASGPFDEATALLKQAVAERKIAGAVAAVSHHGTTVYLESFGVLMQGVPVLFDDEFDRGHGHPSYPSIPANASRSNSFWNMHRPTSPRSLRTSRRPIAPKISRS